MSYEDEAPLYSEKRQRRMRRITWVLIGTLILTTGGSTVLMLLFS